MLGSFARNFAVKLVEWAIKLGLHRTPMFNQVFLALYSVYKLYFEAGPIDRLHEFVPSGSVVIDVGANVGFFSCRFARWVGNPGKVIAIEPEDRNYSSLITVLKRENLLGRVHTVKAVAAASPGTMLLEVNPFHPADHKISRDDTGLAVTAVTLDGLVNDKRFLSPALVKIDVQGAEMLVLEGARDILKIAGPALFIELHEKGLSKFGTSVSAILGYLEGHDYQSFWLNRTGTHLHATSAEIHAKVAKVGYVDVLFLKKRPHVECAKKTSAFWSHEDNEAR